jgi:hypothetical protein
MRAGGAVARAAWTLPAVVVGAWLALTEVFWLPLRVGGVLFPISVVAAVAGNFLLPGLAFRLSGSRLVAVLPGVAWLVVVIGAMGRRPEGDLVVVGTGAIGTLSLVFLLVGVLAAAVAVGRILGAPVRPPVSPGGPAPAPDRTDSGSGGAR